MTLVQSPSTASDTRSTYDRVTRALEWPVAILALAIVPALLLEERATSPGIAAVAVAINWTVWIVFLGEYVLRLMFAPSRSRFMRSSWFDLAIIILSPPFLVPESFESLRALRALRLLRLIRAFAIGAIGLRHLRGALQHRRFHWVAAIAVLTIVAGAAAEYAVEGRGQGTVRSFGDSLWWAIVTATTVGYGDISPATTEGRVIAVTLMIVGIGVIGVFTATIASFFLSQDENSDSATIHRRLDAMDQKLDEVLRKIERR